jgi:tungstate transport system ATP-binding protein
MIQLQGASVNFGGHTALASCSLRVTSGERIAVLGANGSGKSTLLRLLHGQQRPHAGQRRVDPNLTQVMVFQQPHMLRFSVLTNLTLGLWFFNRRQRMTWAVAKEKAQTALAQFDLQPLQNRNAKALSVGQRQRLALVRAWALQPDILFLDEATASLDPAARREVEAMMAQFVQSGCTLVFSSHNLGQAKRLATRIIYLEQGRIVVDLPTSDFFNKALPNEAALFLQSERI